MGKGGKEKGHTWDEYKKYRVDFYIGLTNKTVWVTVFYG